MRYSGLIQPIIVRRSGTHEEMVEAVARASVAAWLSDPTNPAWAPWLAASFGKTVRRARPAEVEKCREWFVASAAVGEAEAFACLPVPTDDMPAPIRKLQVSGTDAERKGWPLPPAPDRPTGPWLSINLGAAMSTGKTAAQAAHGVFAWALKQSPEQLDAWQAEGLPFTVGEAPPDQFDSFRAHAPSTSILIQDAGHTEVTPGTATVLVYDARR